MGNLAGLQCILHGSLRHVAVLKSNRLLAHAVACGNLCTCHARAKQLLVPTLKVYLQQSV
jgi:hypothetical protein